MSDRRPHLPSGTPSWDGNEVWLLVAGGATFAAFPHWYATLFSGFYLPLLLMGEDERTGGVNLREFWMRLARRLLPALYVMMALLMVYITAFYPAVRA